MVSGIIAGDVLEWIPWQCISTVIIDSLDGRGREKHHSLASCHARDLIANAGTESVEEESFERMVVEGSESIRNVKPVMAGVKCCCVLVSTCRIETRTKSYCKATCSYAWHDEGSTAMYLQ